MEAPERPTIIAGERVFLSHVLRDDIPLFTRWFADLELTAYLGQIGLSFTLEHEEQWFARLASQEQTTFAIIVQTDRRVIGTVSLMNFDQRHGVAELGIALGDKRVWGQGYGSEAVRLMTDYGFTFRGLHTIYLWLHGFNARAERAYLKAGYRHAGRLRGATELNGVRYDRILMDCTRADLGPSHVIEAVRQISG